jgi:hypothetical protein
MGNQRWSGLITLIAGFLFIAIPYFIFPVCEFAAQEMVAPHHAPAAMSAGHSKPHMPCFWSARAELGLGLVLIAAGLFLLSSSPPERRLGLSLMIAATAALGGALPTLLIGVCPGAATPCRAGALPALLILSAALFLGALWNAWYLKKIR